MRSPRLLAAAVVTVAVAAVTALAGVPAAAAQPAAPAALAAGSVPMSSCTSADVVVAVDFGHWGGPVVRGCGTTPTTGYQLVNQGGFRTTGTVHDGPGFVCRISSTSYAGGASYPTAAQDPCVQTPPAAAYWASWYAAPGASTWSYSTTGPGGTSPAPGSAQLWTFGSTDTSGSGGSGQPRVTPAQVRAGVTGPGSGGAGTGSGGSPGSGGSGSSGSGSGSAAGSTPPAAGSSAAPSGGATAGPGTATPGAAPSSTSPSATSSTGPSTSPSTSPSSATTTSSTTPSASPTSGAPALVDASGRPGSTGGLDLSSTGPALVGLLVVLLVGGAALVVARRRRTDA